MSSDPSRIESLSAEILSTSKLMPKNTTRPNLQELEVPEEVLVKAFESHGITRKQITDFGTATTELSRSMHHAATKSNIGCIKEAVESGTDPRPLKTRIVGSIGRAMQFNAESVAVKEGEITLKTGEKKAYQTYGSGRGQVIMGNGMGNAMSVALAEEVKAACEGSSFIVPAK